MAPWTAHDRPFLDPAVVARLGTLELKARTIVEGFISGMHRSPFKGFSVEFAEYRQYIPGDDLSTIDWKVYARSDRFYVKKFEEETNLDCHLMMDVSGSMAYGSHHAMTKFEYGACLAASLAYLMNRQRDAVGLTAFDENIVAMLPSSSRTGHLRSLLLTLDRLKPGRRTNVSKPLHLLADSLSKRGMVILISDLLDDPESVIKGLKHFQFRGTDVVVFHILDPDETEFPFERATRFEDLETSEEVMAVPGAVREHYLSEIRALIDRYRRELGGAGIDYQLLSTEQPLELALMSYLSTRARAMTFLSPLFLLGGLAAAVPVVLHLLKREPEARVRFAVVNLLKRAPVEHTARHRLRELLLLALRVATLVLLAVAFARPFFATAGGATVSGVRIVALDTSYSLSAPGRFERAKQLAKDAVARGAAGELVGVVTFADTAHVVSTPSADHVLAMSAIDQAAVSFGATRYRTALSSAVQALAGRHGTIVVVTDLQETGWDAGDRASVPAGTTVETADVGPAPADVAVTNVRVLPDRIVATIRNAGRGPIETRAHLTIDGRAAGDLAVAVGADQSSDATFTGAATGAVAAVSVDDRDGVQADNIRYAVLAASSRPGLLIVGGSGAAGRDAFYVQQALAAGAPGGREYRVTAMSGAQLSSAGDAALSSQSAVLLLSTRALERRGREALAAYVRDGGGLFLAAGPDIDGDVAADVLGGASALRIVTTGTRPEARTLAPADVRHPIFQPFGGASATLSLVRFQNAAIIDGTGCQTLARFTTGAKALLECAAGEGRAIVFASDLDNHWNDFPLHASFVPFLHETMTYLSNAHAHAAEYLVGDAPAAVPKVPGVHEIPPTRPGAPPRRVAVNVDPREANPARITAAEFQSAVAHLKDGGVAAGRVEARQQEDDQHLWQYALALMIVTLVAEGFVASRTT